MQTVIVYRNPLEAAIWESLMDGGWGIMLAVFAIALVGVLTYTTIERVHRNAYRKWRCVGKPYRNVAFLYLHVGKVSITVAAIFAVILHYWYVYM